METNYEKFITANQSLIDCMAKFSKSQIDGMSKSQQDEICQHEGAAVSQMLKNDTVQIKYLIEERLKHMQ